MNIYARYFDYDTLVYNLDELIDFLSSIPEIHVTPEMVEDMRNYIESDMPYPKRYKIRPRVYFILIKTTAESLAAFKANRKKALQNEPPADLTDEASAAYAKKELRVSQLAEEKRGWYRCTIQFKRVLPIPGTPKFQYQDSTLEVCTLATTGQECYDRMISYLRSRKDIDPRSQFPSAKGQNFQFEFVGDKPCA